MYKLHFIAALILSTFLACKKNEPLPELGIGNDLNPESGVEIIIFDSIKTKQTYPKAVQMYFKINSAAVNSAGATIKKVRLYRNSQLRGEFNPTQNYFIDNFMSPGTYTYEYKILTTQDELTKGTIPFTAVIY